MSEAPTTDFLSNRLESLHIDVSYGERPIIEDLSFRVPDGKFTVIVGPNACGKSTLLRTLARIIRPGKGSVILDGKQIERIPAREVARTLGLLPQSSIAPNGITVADLVARGRYPHQTFLQRWTELDEKAVNWAMQTARVDDIAERAVDELSGGQRQRVWIAMVLAQETPLLLLDEPTTFLDIAHQIELLNLLRNLNRKRGNTIVAVLHDLNQACRYADHIVAMRQGRILAEGNPCAIMTAELVETVFGLPCVVIDDPITGDPMVVPLDKSDED
ncbi:ATP-binding cassette domain-containing protein [Brucella sp. BO3]|uniref:ABC transporter ATP-binding protein n=1 Tax=Brucella inopinata TaxID=1218315 RepID=A0AAW7B5W8_9HYPH|nr:MULTISPECIES: ABC transporter ATP-binding protein [Brucella]KEY03959.1 iron-dicitrate transporter ATP-binding subunit [Brucella suis bv. 4 str. 40]APY15602.1 iron-dicitrate transporter ATP-binding subunit [Brucella sp. 09RB8910]MDL2332817.1 ABC transporter ATP-binding protein [Brucella inopinata]MRN46928.1 ATP-binding cassette domain-containing protein [Brucella sp. 10RB9212]MRN49920.1 ATP-binding cassette domain-containing protein [Brucella sp. 10RB9214]